jgi:hypothetical protein
MTCDPGTILKLLAVVKAAKAVYTNGNILDDDDWRINAAFIRDMEDALNDLDAP